MSKHAFVCQRCHEVIEFGRISICQRCLAYDRFKPGKTYLERLAERRKTPLPDIHGESYWSERRERWRDQQGLNLAETEHVLTEKGSAHVDRKLTRASEVAEPRPTIKPRS